MRSLWIMMLLFLIAGCGEEMLVPKPPTYLRLELPEHKYIQYSDENCPYTFSVQELFTVKSVDGDGNACHKDVDLGPLNGSLHISYIEMEEPLSTYVNFVNDKVDEHKVMASAIDDWKILRPENNVYCTFFELQGDVASPFQFYLTDSVDHFMSGVVYFNAVPNYDSLKPSLDYLKVDLEYMIKSLQWRE